MVDFVEKLRLKGKAEEDLYFARRDRDLIEAMHRRADRLALDNECSPCDDELKIVPDSAKEK